METLFKHYSINHQ